jgi:hypothetical protein
MTMWADRAKLLRMDRARVFEPRAGHPYRDPHTLVLGLPTPDFRGR